MRFREAGGKGGWVVLAKDDDSLEDLVPHWAEILTNPDPSRGPFSSLQIAAQAALAAEAPGAFLLPLDVPAPTQDVWEALEASLIAGIFAAIPTHHQRGGHPVLLSAPFLKLIAEAPVSSRLDELIRALPEEKRSRVEVEDPRILANWNTPADVGPTDPA